MTPRMTTTPAQASTTMTTAALCQWQCRGNGSCLEYVHQQCCMLHGALTLVPGVGVGIGCVWVSIEGVQGKLASSVILPSLRPINSRRDGGIIFWRSRHVPQLRGGVFVFGNDRFIKESDTINVPAKSLVYPLVLVIPSDNTDVMTTPAPAH